MNLFRVRQCIFKMAEPFTVFLRNVFKSLSYDSSFIEYLLDLEYHFTSSIWLFFNRSPCGINIPPFFSPTL